MVQKTVQDYYDILASEYPEIPLNDIKKIVLYGWKEYYLHNSRGGDVLLTRNGFWMYCGQLMNNSLKYFEYYARKMCVKLRTMYRRKKIKWDGYYYFALSLKQYDNYLALKKQKGRPRKNFKFEKVMLYKIYDECSIREHSKVAIFKIPLVLGNTFVKYKPILETDRAELILTRMPLKFEDILFSNYDYQFISDDLRKYKKKNNG